MNLGSQARSHLKNDADVHWHDQSLWFIRQKRDKAIKDVPEWEELRNAAQKIKNHTLSHLGYYLNQFEENAIQRGLHVHWAADGREHNEIVLKLLHKHKVKRVVKSKSMLTEECQLNPYLEHNGIEVTDTDLGERIVQLRSEPPSHIVLPAIHLKRKQISELFHEHLNSASGNDDPSYLTEIARQHLRKKFIQAEAGITGVNFAIAETGGIVVCTNEGNADLGTSLPKLHIACMGLEKIIPTLEHLPVFLRLLARSATGQALTTYTTHFHEPQNGSEIHIVIVDNQRTNILKQQDFKSSLGCIRCGACMNTCPVYRKSGGHSYQYTIPGPIGSVLAPQHSLDKHKHLPFASSLCGSCTHVCPVKINLHEQLLLLRGKIVSRQKNFIKKISSRIICSIITQPKLYHWATKCLRFMIKNLPRALLYNRFNKWGLHREMPDIPESSFMEAFKKTTHDK